MPCWCQNNPKPPLSLIWGSLLCQRSEKEVDKVWNKVSGSFSADILNNIPVIWLWKQPLYCFVVPLHVFNCSDSDQQSFGMRWAGRGPKPPPLQHLCLSLPVMSLLGRLEIATCHARYWQYGAPFIRSSKLAKAFCLLHFWRFTYDIEIVHTFVPQET